MMQPIAKLVSGSKAAENRNRIFRLSKNVFYNVSVKKSMSKGKNITAYEAQRPVQFFNFNPCPFESPLDLNVYIGLCEKTSQNKIRHK